jgi:hypothetical protein
MQQSLGAPSWTRCLCEKMGNAIYQMVITESAEGETVHAFQQLQCQSTFWIRADDSLKRKSASLVGCSSAVRKRSLLEWGRFPCELG